MSKKNKWFPAPSLPCVGVESHAHLTHGQLFEQLSDVIKRATDAGVSSIGQVILGSEEYFKFKSALEEYNNIFFIMGIHPTGANLYDDSEHQTIASCVKENSRIKAIGEIGLDYHWKEVEPKIQKDVFRKMITLAKDSNLPIVIHSREAEDDTLEILKEEGIIGYPLLWHCFGGSYSLAKKILDSGWHISIPGTITYPSNNVLREAVASIPLDKLLIETDCPYLAPVPYRGKTNEPAYLGYTVEVMANVKNLPVDEVWTACGDNARRFFKL